MASPHLVALSLDSPLHVSTPAHAHATRLSNDQKGHVGRNYKKPVLFQQVLSTSYNDNLSDDVSYNDQPKLTSRLQTCLNSASHTSQQPERHRVKSGIKQASEHLESDSFEEETVWDDKYNASVDVSRQIGKPATYGGMPDVKISEHCLQLSSWGIPNTVLNKYKEVGITTMFQWQAECLCTGNVLSGGNLVYSAPTSAGKTLVAELLILKRIMETKKKAIVILPFVSVAREKMFYFQKIFQDAGIRVDGYMGTQSATGGFSSLDVAICTIEKANGLINRLLEEGKIDLLGMIVVDELHMVGDANRGYLLELLLTKIKFVEAKAKHRQNEKSGDTGRCSVQIVGMSATLPNLDLLARWLNADLYHTEFRPVSLMEMMKVGKALYDVNGRKVRDLDLMTVYKGDEDGVITMCLEVIRTGHSVLIFCPTKSWCEKLADSIARIFYGLRHGTAEKQTGGFVKASSLLAPKLNESALKDVIEQLKRTPVGLDKVLARVIPQGVAYHHAGLTFDERDVIEGAFRQLAIRVLVATSTLSSGVNLPARRVIIRTPIFNRNVLDTLTYKQMVGRAGRKGIDTYGESILICKPAEKIKAETLMKSDLAPVRSCLIKSDSDSLSVSMKRAILEVIVSGVASTPEQVDEYAKCTLLAASIDKDVISTDVNKDGTLTKRTGVIEKCIEFLVDNELISLRKCLNEDGVVVEQYVATNLGSAVLASALSPDEGLSVFMELQKARRCFVLENDLHIIYLVTPIYMADQWGSIDWYKYLCYWEQLSSGMKRVAELVGVSESFLSRAVQGRIATKTVQQLRTLRIHKRFYTALVLHDLVNEHPLPEVANKYGCARGMLQSLQQGAATFAGMVTVFCNRLGWTSLEILLDQFQSRLTFGVQRELVDLVRITVLNAQRARALYNGGLQNVAAVSNADSVVVEKLLKTSVPFQSKKTGDGETDWEAAERQKSRCIWVAGQKALTEQEAAILIIEEAKHLLKADLEQMGVHWTPQQTNSSSPVRSATKSSRIHRSRGHRSSKKNKRGKSRNNTESDLSCESHNSVLSPPPAITLSRIVNNAQIVDNGQILHQSGSNLETVHNSAQQVKSSDGSIFVKPALRVKPNRSSRRSSVLNASENTAHSHSAKECVKAEDDKFCDHREGHEKETCAGEIDKDEGASGSSGNNLNTDSIHAINEHDSINGGLLDGSVSELTDSKILQLVSAASQNPIAPNSVNKTSLSSSIPTEPKSNVSAELYSESLECVPDEGVRMNKSADSADSKQLVTDRNQHNVSDELYTEPLNQNIQTNCCNMTNDSFLLDTQVLHLITNFSSSPHHASISDLERTSDDSAVEEDKDHSISLNKKITANSPVSVINSAADGCADCTPLIYSDPEQNSMLDEYMNEYCTQAVSILDADVQLSSNRIIGKNLFTCLHKESSTPNMDGSSGEYLERNMKPYLIEDSPLGTSVVDGSGIKDEAVLCTSYLEQAITDKQEGGELLPGSCYDRLVPPTYDNESLLKTEMSVSQPADEQANSVLQKMLNSQLVSSSRNYTNLREDMEIAKNMEYDSFSFVTPKQNIHNMENLEMNVSNHLKSGTKKKLNTENNTGSTSLSLSMLQRELDSELGLQVAFDGNTTPLSDKSVSGSPLVRIEDGHSLEFSPEMTALLGAICHDVTPGNHHKRAPRRSTRKCVANRKTPSPCTLGVAPAITPSAGKRRSTLVKSVGSPPKMRRSSPQTNQSHDESAGSECVPPTPPPADDACNRAKVGTPQRLLGGVLGSPQSKKKTKKDRQHSVSGSQNPSQHSASSRISKQRKKIDTDAVSVMEADNKQNNEASQPLSVSLPMTNESFTIIDVASSEVLFEHFASEWATKSLFALAVACERLPPATNTPVIGGNFKKAVKKLKRIPDALFVEDMELLITGLAVSWDNKDVYYIAFTRNNDACDPDDSLCPPPIAKDLPVSVRLAKVKAILESANASQGEDRICLAFDAKEQLKVLSRACGIWIRSDCHDPKVAAWLLNPEDSEKNLHRMVHNYIPQEGYLLEDLGGGVGLGSVALNPDNPGSGRLRASVEAVLVRHLMVVLEKKLRDVHLWSVYKEVEMPSLVLLSRMELNGFGFSKEECETQKTILQAKMTSLEEEAYSLAGHAFSLTSTEDISQVLFIELHLPPSGDSSAPAVKKRLGPRRKVRGSHFSTSKDILEKLKVLHPLPGIILEWRRLNAILTKVVFPYQRECVYNERLSMNRVHGLTQFHTATGRVSMSEPNIQNIPKNFDIDLKGVPGHDINRVFTTGQHLKENNSNVEISYNISMRHAFVPFKGAVILAADYSQLELRLLAHLSGDRKLRNVLNSGGDVFKTIAAQWKGVDVQNITDSDRQHAKQICYGMIYGIGPKALGEQIGVNETDAAVFMESFKSKYTGMRKYLQTTVQRCRELGYVETISGRRRYLPAINDKNMHAKSHAERQAVNTTIQGSAADLVKKAMIDIDSALWQMFPDTRVAHRQKRIDSRSATCSHSRHNQCSRCSPRGAYFVLQLHDELIYEVNEHDLHRVAALVKNTMESAMKLSVRLPVKVKVGPTWGSIQEMNIH